MRKKSEEVPRLQQLKQDLEGVEAEYYAMCRNESTNVCYMRRLEKDIETIQWMIKKEQKRDAKKA